MNFIQKKKKNDGLHHVGKVPPSKEDILNTIDSYGKNNHDDIGHVPENNNKTPRRGSKSSINSDDWEKPEAEPEPMSASFSNSYSAEWEKLFTKKNFRKILRNYAMSGHLRSSRYRSVCWKVFLDVLPDDISQWVAYTRKWRQKYEDLKDNLIVNPRKAVDNSSSDLVVNNPLSQADESPWNQFFMDNELRLTIKQDVIRTFPEVEFFHKDDIQDKMVDLLFCFSKTNESLSYKQGMHELLAPLIFVLHCDHQAFLHASEVETLEDIVKEVMDPSYLEHDAYALLCQIMETVAPWYLSKDIPMPKGKEKMNSIPFARPQDMNPSNAIVTKLTRVQDYILKKFDVELHSHLERLEIAPQIYGIRWVRLLFGREFPMQDLLALWDALFADGIGFVLVDYIFVAMLLYIRDLLLASDYPQCLNCLMRYPPVGDVHYLIEKAQYLREPNHYPRPPIYTYQNINVKPTAQKASSQTPASHTTSANKQRSSFSDFSSKMRPKTLHVSADAKSMQKSSSVPMFLQTEISPGTPQQQKRGSSASLSQVEDTMFSQSPSPNSMARLETTSHRAGNLSPAGFTPEDGPMNGSVSHFTTLPRSKARGRKGSKQEVEYERVICDLQGQINEKENMNLYCASKLDMHITRLQTEILHQNLDNEDEIFLAIAGIKQVRDVLKGTLKFSQMDEEEIQIKDNYYVNETSGSHEYEQQEAQEKLNSKTDHPDKKGKIFYMSSEEISESADSPTEGAVQMTSSRKNSRESSKDVELNGCRSERSGSTRSSGSHERRLLPKTPDCRDVSEKVHPLEASPNPLYNLQMLGDSD